MGTSLKVQPFASLIWNQDGAEAETEPPPPPQVSLVLSRPLVGNFFFAFAHQKGGCAKPGFLHLSISGIFSVSFFSWSDPSRSRLHSGDPPWGGGVIHQPQSSQLRLPRNFPASKVGRYAPPCVGRWQGCPPPSHQPGASGQRGAHGLGRLCPPCPGSFCSAGQ